jgi:dCTP deaminase
MDPGNPLGDRLVVEPFLDDDDATKAPPASIDVHLGNRFVFLRRGRSVLQDPLELSHYPASSDNPEAQGTEVFLPFGAAVFLHPGQLVLGHTLEWIRLPSTLTAHVDGRSIWGRRGLIVVTASAVQPGSAGTITLELANAGEVAVVISPGAAVAQLLFDEVTAMDLRGKRPPFGVGNKPSFGRYRKSRLERALLDLDRLKSDDRGAT